MTEDTKRKYPNVVTDDEGKKYTIRKLTEKECFRLMGFNDEEFGRLEALKDSKGKRVFPKTALYKFAGNSIVVDTLACVMESAIFGNSEKRE